MDPSAFIGCKDPFGLSLPILQPNIQNIFMRGKVRDKQPVGRNLRRDLLGKIEQDFPGDKPRGSLKKRKPRKRHDRGQGHHG
jgi:hypothetical protein